MSSDLETSTETDEDQALKKSAEQILNTEIREGISAMQRTTGSLALSGLSAGLDLGFGVLLMAVIWKSAHGKLSDPTVEILMANMYSVGFIFVVIGRSELFTEQTTLAVLPVLDGQASVRALLRAWATILLSNLVVIVWIITTTIGLAGFHHVVLGSVEVLTGSFLHQQITVLELFRFICFAALGNIAGGVIFVALIKYGHARPGAHNRWAGFDT